MAPHATERKEQVLLGGQETSANGLVLGNHNQRSQNQNHIQNPNSNNSICNNNTDKGKPFKQRRSFETRKLESESIKKKFPTKIPVVVERYQRESNLPEMDKAKFLVPQELTMMNFAIIIKQRLGIASSRAFYFVIDNQSMVSTSKTIAEIYREHKDADGFLYMTYASQEMFGSNCATFNGFTFGFIRNAGLLFKRKSPN